MFSRGVDHVAILVRDTEEALTFYRDVLGFPVLLSEVVNEPPVRLTHLDLGNLQLQLVEPIGEDHPLRRELDTAGERLHHLCFAVEDVEVAVGQLMAGGLPPRGSSHSGPQGRWAAFIHPDRTRGVLLEITGQKPDTVD